MKTATLRLRRVRFKDGRTIEVMRPRDTEDRVMREQWAKHVPGLLDDFYSDGMLSGFAIVVWGRDGQTTAYTMADDKIPSILVPDLVRNRLLAQRIEDWTIDTLNNGPR